MIPFPEVIPGEPVKISATTYLSYRRCPAQAEARFRHIYEPESTPTFRGALAHRLFARHLRSGEISDVEQACREEIGGGLNHRLVALGSRPSELRSVIADCGALYQRFRLLGVDGFSEAEVQINVEPAEGVQLVGQLDAVFTEADGERIVDWKTGNLGEPLYQLHFYALLWALERDRIPLRLEAVSVQTGETFEARPSRTDLVEVASELASMVSTLRKSWQDSVAVETRGGPWCRHCPILSGCVEGTSSVALLGELVNQPED